MIWFWIGCGLAGLGALLQLGVCRDAVKRRWRRAADASLDGVGFALIVIGLVVVRGAYMAEVRARQWAMAQMVAVKASSAASIRNLPAEVLATLHGRLQLAYYSHAQLGIGVVVTVDDDDRERARFADELVDLLQAAGLPSARQSAAFAQASVVSNPPIVVRCHPARRAFAQALLDALEPVLPSKHLAVIEEQASPPLGVKVVEIQLRQL